jgi:pyruvate-ferredoxin/flavodoxin oxidoreductase
MDLTACYPVKFAAKLQEDWPFNDLPELYRQERSALHMSGETAIRLLAWELACRRESVGAFHRQVRSVTRKLSASLPRHGHKTEGNGASVKAELAFAQDLIAFDKLNQLSDATEQHHRLPTEYPELIRETLQVLRAAQDSFRGTGPTIFTTQPMEQACQLENHLHIVAAEVVIVDNPCAEARVRQQEQLAQLVDTIAALRKGELLLNQDYAASLHDAYFAEFGLSHLRTEDLLFLAPLLVIEDSRQLQRHAGDLLALCTDDSQVKVLAINTLDTLSALEDPAAASYLELASLAIMRRNTYVFQGGLEAPARLRQAYAQGLAFPGPVLWNVLVPSADEQDDRQNYLRLLAAAESRFFPRIEYRTEDNHFSGQQLRLDHNPEPESPFAAFTLRGSVLPDKASTQAVFTVADFLAMDSQGRERLQLLSDTDSGAVTVADYLLASERPSVTQPAYLCLADTQQHIHKLAVPRSWLRLCRGRLEYWRLLQTLAGADPRPSASTLVATEPVAAAEIRAELEAHFAKTRATDLQQAIVRILYRLLDPDQEVETLLTTISVAEDLRELVAAPNPPLAESTTEKKTTEIITPVEETAISEAWVDTEDCTSCGDCINALSAVFKYNDDKQAYVHNPKGGSFAQIVAAAEKCPAACIHPGVPQNQEEAELEKWLKRAAKFN